jgi:hypothetical protein
MKNLKRKKKENWKYLKRKKTAELGPKTLGLAA